MDSTASGLALECAEGQEPSWGASTGPNMRRTPGRGRGIALKGKGKAKAVRRLPSRWRHLTFQTQEAEAAVCWVWQGSLDDRGRGGGDGHGKLSQWPEESEESRRGSDLVLLLQGEDKQTQEGVALGQGSENSRAIWSLVIHLLNHLTNKVLPALLAQQCISFPFSESCSSSREIPRSKGSNHFIPESKASEPDDIRRCGRGIHPGGVGAAEPCSEGPLQGGDAGELQEPGLSGPSSIQTICDLPVGGRGRALHRGERNLNRGLLRLGEKV
ncbi:zinc finger protein 514 isoform X8 [Macaca fascicularis]|uniref:zinc finger protein 514 isoform X8 n=1 Tax=Macaca fascicularis TaxID=9541 RepID=UPI003D15E031